MNLTSIPSSATCRKSPRTDTVNIKINPADRDTIEWICRENDSMDDRSIVSARHVGGLRRLFALRHGNHLPDTPIARRHLFALLQNLAKLPFSNARTLALEIERLAPWMQEAELLDTIARAGRRRTIHRGATLGKIVGLVDEEREACGCWSIWPIDLSLAEAKLRTKNKDRAYQADKRRAAGASPQSESLARTKPWIAVGLGRTKWFEMQKQAREASDVVAVAGAAAGADCFVGSIIGESYSRPDETVRTVDEDAIDLPIPSVDRRAPQRDGATARRWLDADDLDGVGSRPPPRRASSPPPA